MFTFIVIICTFATASIPEKNQGLCQLYILYVQNMYMYERHMAYAKKKKYLLKNNNKKNNEIWWCEVLILCALFL